jgi:hypothetical protein
LGFPVVTQNFFNSVLVELEFLVELVNPDDLVHNFREVTRLIQGLVHSIFIQQLTFQLFNVLLNLSNQLELVLSNGASNLGPHKQLVVHGKHLEHFIGRSSFLQLLLKLFGELGLNLARAHVVDFLGLVP